jgi:hypothetical protein
MIDLDEVVQSIRAAYGSLDHPRFDFVADSVRARTYPAMIGQLAQWFSTQDDTDVNTDVSFGCLLASGCERWLLRVSMVGPYAVLVRLGREVGGVVLSGPTASSSEAEQQLIGTVAASGLRLLDRDLLSRTVPLRLLAAPSGTVSVYQALFVDTDFPPWQR